MSARKSTKPLDRAQIVLYASKRKMVVITFNAVNATLHFASDVVKTKQVAIVQELQHCNTMNDR